MVHGFSLPVPGVEFIVRVHKKRLVLCRVESGFLQPHVSPFLSGLPARTSYWRSHLPLEFAQLPGQQSRRTLT